MQLNDPSLLKTECYLNGKWQSASTGNTINIINPATGKKLASVPSMSAEEAQEAVAQYGQSRSHKYRGIARLLGLLA